MYNKPPAKSSFSLVRVIVLIVILIPVLLIIWGSVSRQNEYNRLQKEISRVEAKTGIKSLSIDCHDVELAAVCFVEYESLSYQKINTMLSSSGYAISGSSSPDNIDAQNTETMTSIGAEVGDNSRPAVMRYKDINVTL